MLRDTNVLKRRDIEYLSTSGVSARSFAFTPGHLGNTATTKEAAMETREQNELRVDTGDALRNPLLAFIGRHYYAPPAPGQAPGVAWQADIEGHPLWLPRLAGRLHMGVPDLRALLYDVASLSTPRRADLRDSTICHVCPLASELGTATCRQYDEYCAAIVWARLLANRHILVVDGVACYDAYALAAALNWFTRTGWKYRLMDARLATTRWNRRVYTTEEAISCWLAGRPRPDVPNLAAAVRAAGSARKLTVPTVSKLSGTFGRTWVNFHGERYIWRKEATRLYHVSARTLRRARREGKLQACIVYAEVLIPFESLRPFLTWWYGHGCTWRGAKKAKGASNEQ